MSSRWNDSYLTPGEAILGLGGIAIAAGSVMQWTSEAITSIDVSTGPTADSEITGGIDGVDGVHGLESFGPLTGILALALIGLVYFRITNRRRTNGRDPRIDISGYRLKVYNIAAVGAVLTLGFFLSGADPEGNLAIGGVLVLLGSLLVSMPSIYHGVILRLVRLFITREEPREQPPQQPRQREFDNNMAQQTPNTHHQPEPQHRGPQHPAHNEPRGHGQPPAPEQNPPPRGQSQEPAYQPQQGEQSRRPNHPDTSQSAPPREEYQMPTEPQQGDTVNERPHHEGTNHDGPPEENRTESTE